MLKKVLFIVASLFVGLLLIINSIGSSFSQQVVKQAKNAVEEKKYADAERFVAYALDLNNMFYKGDLENGTHVEIFSSISTKTVTETSGEGEDATVNSYNIMQIDKMGWRKQMIEIQNLTIKIRKVCVI